jgi:YD repeat-containing protein
MPDMLAKVVVASLGPRVEIEYTTLADDAGVHEPGACSYPQICPSGGNQVVSQHRIANGSVGGWNRFDHYYQAARVDLLGRGWLGFAQHTVYDRQTGATTVTELDNQTRDVGATVLYPYAHLPARTIFTVNVDGTTEYRRIITNTYALRRLPVPGTYTVKLRNRVDAEYERPVRTSPWPAAFRSSTTSFAYDTFGNQTYSDADVDDGRKLIEDRQYNNDISDWFIGKVTRLAVIGCTRGGTCKRRVTKYQHDTRGNLEEIVIEPPDDGEPPNPRLFLNRVIEYTSHGMVASVTDSDAKGQRRSQRFEYDDDGVYATGVTNALGQTTRFTVHSGLGVLLASTDPNGVRITMRYDGFGRIREINAPDGSYEHIDYKSGEVGPIAIETASSGGALVLSN